MNNLARKKTSRLLLALFMFLILTAGKSGPKNFLLPFEGGPYKITDGPGSGFHTEHMAEAIDFDLPFRTEIYPAKPGTVSAISIDRGGFGFWIAIYHFDGTISYYAHLSSIKVAPGDRIDYDTLIGLSGNSGNVFPKPYECERAPYCGDHLHFGMMIYNTFVKV